MKRKTIFLLMCLSLFLIYNDAFAEKKKDEGQSWVRTGDVLRLPEDGEYMVKEGDTLWDITHSFLKDPFKWPDLWKENPYIINPHLIYPGNKIRLYFPKPIEAEEKAKEVGVEAEPTVPEGLPVEKLQKPEEPAAVVTEEKPDEEVVAVQIPPVPEEIPIVVKISSAMMERRGLISDKKKEGVGVIIGAKEEKMLLAENDIVFISIAKGTDVNVGDRFTIFTIVGKVKHPVTRKTVGFLTETLGVVKVTQIDEKGAITAKIEKSYKEILKGSKLIPYEPPVKEVVVKKAEKTIDGLIIESLEGKVGVAENDIVYLDGGKNSGLAVGYTMNIFRPAGKAKDPLSEEKRIITFPHNELGKLVVIAVEDDTATAFITNSRQVIYKGDNVRTVE
ncbi:MAG: hypothetical protein A2X87_03640 [Deltaproteobacteria bacterium GWC2_42_51]|nr:MAG: hypothetical protein A2X87_03640 [Deltaproteobacteria bacterium GWC2_42_51]OGP39161.1 MAG: hypothetical protein A2090_00860 [Deltaproteobacteria bacterium GWD2_42_10]OGP46499.1 MAG: hypothetical protein A2022_01555 [Deltaproteobacteria bacterium GWF2_42_12]OGQ24120.1 MAG: hypothetical protein A3D29_07860 [Deltaproteobacteria bacterium RIFCSPHIGHO2_02_FULL_42_44]OGQ36655.1 MAG: hypothetical protein A3H47_02365 [Deltaproteobacteria bacterium RIFCSPLOWO2_02_FULL_42_39]OGQ67143.1 MAG: hypo